MKALKNSNHFIDRKVFLTRFPEIIGSMVLLKRKGFFPWLKNPHFSLLREFPWQDSGASVAEFLSASMDFRGRFVGGVAGPDFRIAYERAVYSLIYLCRNEWLITLMTQFYCPIVLFDELDERTRLMVATTFEDDAFYALYDVEKITPAGDHEPFDWAASLNQFSEEWRNAWLDRSGILPLANPRIPPQQVWIAHTNVQPIPEDEYMTMMQKMAEFPSRRTT